MNETETKKDNENLKNYKNLFQIKKTKLFDQSDRMGRYESFEKFFLKKSKYFRNIQWIKGNQKRFCFIDHRIRIRE